jgi:hypothetical protein
VDDLPDPLGPSIANTSPDMAVVYL